MIHSVKGFGVVNKADVFLELSYFLYDPTDVWSLVLLPFEFLPSAKHNVKYFICTDTNLHNNSIK